MILQDRHTHQHMTNILQAKQETFTDTSIYLREFSHVYQQLNRFDFSL